jgi:hypothetical protein
MLLNNRTILKKQDLIFLFVETEKSGKSVSFTIRLE